jgi:hypothetical protein
MYWAFLKHRLLGLDFGFHIELIKIILAKNYINCQQNNLHTHLKKKFAISCQQRLMIFLDMLFKSICPDHRIGLAVTFRDYILHRCIFLTLYYITFYILPCCIFLTLDYILHYTLLYFSNITFYILHCCIFLTLHYTTYITFYILHCCIFLTFHAREGTTARTLKRCAHFLEVT